MPSVSVLFTFERCGGKTYQVIALHQIDAADAVSRAAHGAHIVLAEANGHARVGGEKDDLVAIGAASANQLVIVVDADGNNAARHDIGKVLERSLLNGALTGGEEDELAVLFQVAHRQDGAHALSLLQAEETGHGL